MASATVPRISPLAALAVLVVVGMATLAQATRPILDGPSVGGYRGLQQVSVNVQVPEGGQGVRFKCENCQAREDNGTLCPVGWVGACCKGPAGDTSDCYAAGMGTCKAVYGEKSPEYVNSYCCTPCVVAG